jgi:hypothetical protein
MFAVLWLYIVSAMSKSEGSNSQQIWATIMATRVLGKYPRLTVRARNPRKMKVRP